MAFTYDLTTNIGKVRLLIPDNDATAYDLEDDEITYMLTDVGNSVKAAAVRCCRWLARKYAKQATFSADGLSVHHTERAQAFAARANELEAELNGGWSAPSITREDGYSENAATSEYEGRTRLIYIDTN